MAVCLIRLAEIHVADSDNQGALALLQTITKSDSSASKVSAATMAEGWLLQGRAEDALQMYGQAKTSYESALALGSKANLPHDLIESIGEKCLELSLRLPDPPKDTVTSAVKSGTKYLDLYSLDRSDDHFMKWIGVVNSLQRANQHAAAISLCDDFLSGLIDSEYAPLVSFQRLISLHGGQQDQISESELLSLDHQFRRDTPAKVTILEFLMSITSKRDPKLGIQYADRLLNIYKMNPTLAPFVSQQTRWIALNTKVMNARTLRDLNAEITYTGALCADPLTSPVDTVCVEYKRQKNMREQRQLIQLLLLMSSLLAAIIVYWRFRRRSKATHSERTLPA